MFAENNKVLSFKVISDLSAYTLTQYWLGLSKPTQTTIFKLIGFFQIYASVYVPEAIFLYLIIHIYLLTPH